MSSTEENTRRYADAMHAVQSGVAAQMEVDGSPTTPKHLRVGVNSALIASSALAELLVQKGIITEDEYFEVLAEGAEAEKALYEKWLSEHYGQSITLG